MIGGMYPNRRPLSPSDVIWGVTAAVGGVLLSVSLFRGDLALIAGSVIALIVATIKIRTILKKR
jgi:multidrug transporter EmrE-like cation transporter